MGQEDDRDELPNAVQARVFTQGWYLIQAQVKRPDMGQNLRLVALKVESRGLHGGGGVDTTRGECIERVDKTRGSCQISNRRPNRLRSALGQRLADPLAPFLLSFPMVLHLTPEVLGIENQAVKEELRGNVRTAPPARRFFYEVVLSGHACPECNANLVMVGRMSGIHIDRSRGRVRMLHDDRAYGSDDDWRSRR